MQVGYLVNFDVFFCPGLQYSMNLVDSYVRYNENNQNLDFFSFFLTKLCSKDNCSSEEHYRTVVNGRKNDENRHQHCRG